MIPTTRADLRKIFYRVVSTDADDEGLVEHGEVEDEVANYCLQYGIWAAQDEMIGMGYRGWLAVVTLTWVTGADGIQYADLPSNFLRVAGDERDSAIFAASTGTRWGALVAARLKRNAGSGTYWIEGDRVILGRNSSPPSGLSIEIHTKHGDLDDYEDDPVDFPTRLTPMIAAEAAFIGMQESWLTGGIELEAKINRNLGYWHRQASKHVRGSQEPQKLRMPAPTASNIFLGR